eukprot:3345093-Rhodomonas_salina.3
MCWCRDALRPILGNKRQKRTPAFDGLTGTSVGSPSSEPDTKFWANMQTPSVLLTVSISWLNAGTGYIVTVSPWAPAHAHVRHTSTADATQLSCAQATLECEVSRPGLWVPNLVVAGLDIHVSGKVDGPVEGAPQFAVGALAGVLGRERDAAARVDDSESVVEAREATVQAWQPRACQTGKAARASASSRGQHWTQQERAAESTTKRVRRRQAGVRGVAYGRSTREGCRAQEARGRRRQRATPLAHPASPVESVRDAQGRSHARGRKPHFA